MLTEEEILARRARTIARRLRRKASKAKGEEHNKLRSLAIKAGQEARILTARARGHMFN